MLHSFIPILPSPSFTRRLTSSLAITMLSLTTAFVAAETNNTQESDKLQKSDNTQESAKIQESEKTEASKSFGRDLRKSVVRISVASQKPNFQVPWNPGQLSGGNGAGFVIDGERVMTNAHVVSNARFLAIEKDNDPRRYVAQVEHVAHDADLAVLKVQDASFFDDMTPLEFDGIPPLESQVSVYGFPIGGDRMSVTRGVVSRIDFQVYSHSGADAHLAIQIDAAINPGNSGGPVLQNGEVVGVAFQGYSGDVAQNVGYMIAVPVIKRFLEDIEDGKYDRYVDLGMETFPLQNPAHRRALGLEADNRGILVGHVISEGSAHGQLEEGDVLLSIDGLPITSDGSVEIEGEQIDMPEVVERKFKGDTVTFEILRNGEKMAKTLTLQGIWPYLINANKYDSDPRFVLYGGLLFQPLSSNFMQANKVNDLRVRYFYNHFVEEEIFKEHPEVIVLSGVLPDPINAYLSDFRMNIVETINGQEIDTLSDVAEALDQPKDGFTVIELLGVGRPIVLDVNEVKAARERILQRYNVRQEQNLGTPDFEL